MSYPSTNPIGALDSTQGAGDYSLARKQVFDTRVQQQFIQMTPMWNGEIPILLRKDVTGGKVFKFNMRNQTTSAGASNVPAGTFIQGGLRSFVEDTIDVDGEPLVAAQDYPIDHIKFADFNIMEDVSGECAMQLAMLWEKRINALHITAARTSSLTKNGQTIHSGGLRVTKTGATFAGAYADTLVGAQAFRTSVAELGYQADLRNIPRGNRWLRMHPYARKILRWDTSIFSSDFNRPLPNTMNQRVVGELEGFICVVDPNLEDFNATTITDRYSKYNMTTNATVGIPIALASWGSESGKYPVGVATSQGVYTHMEFDEWTNVAKTKAQVMMGADVMHPFAAGIIDVIT